MRTVMSWVTLSASSPVNLDHLIQDPCGLPLRTTPLPETFLRTEIEKGLMGFITNEKVLDLFTKTDEATKDILISNLLRIQPCHPKLMNIIYSLTTFGITLTGTSDWKILRHQINNAGDL